MDIFDLNVVSYFLGYGKRFVRVGKLKMRYIEDDCVILFQWLRLEIFENRKDDLRILDVKGGYFLCDKSFFCDLKIFRMDVNILRLILLIIKLLEESIFFFFFVLIIMFLRRLSLKSKKVKLVFLISELFDVFEYFNYVFFEFCFWMFIGQKIKLRELLRFVKLYDFFFIVCRI